MYDIYAESYTSGALNLTMRSSDEATYAESSHATRINMNMYAVLRRESAPSH